MTPDEARGSAADSASAATRVETVPAALFETAADREALERAEAAAAPVSPERPDPALVQSLDPSLRPLVHSLLSSLADNKYLLGRRYAEWCTGAPTLESAVASAAMAQDELGHARSFYPLLRSFAGGDEEAVSMEERGWQRRPVVAVAPLEHRFESWPAFIAANFVVDTAFTVLLEAAQDSPYEPLRQRARKIVQEEAAHWVHADRWTVRLSKDEQRRSQLERALARVWDPALAWYGPTDDPVVATLHEQGILAAGPDGLRQTLRQRLLTALEEGRLAEGLASRVVSWSGWDGQSRQLRGSP